MVSFVGGSDSFLEYIIEHIDEGTPSEKYIFEVSLLRDDVVMLDCYSVNDHMREWVYTGAVRKPAEELANEEYGVARRYNTRLTLSFERTPRQRDDRESYLTPLAYFMQVVMNGEVADAYTMDFEGMNKGMVLLKYGARKDGKEVCRYEETVQLEKSAIPYLAQAEQQLAACVDSTVEFLF